MKFTGETLKTKLKATGIHLSISLLIFVYLSYKIYFDWYPLPYFEIDGGWQGIRLIGAVDLVLGPFVTFLIFDLAKSRREIIFDLLTIAVIQFGALAYGVYMTYAQRPVAIVLIDEFVVPAIMEQYGNTLTSARQLYAYSDERPPIVYADLPLEHDKLEEINRIKIEQKVLEHAQLDLYRPDGLTQALKERQLLFFGRMDKLGGREAFQAWLKENGKAEDEILVAPFSGRFGKAWLVFDPEGRYLSYFYPEAPRAEK
jgi:hypothetical protein